MITFFEDAFAYHYYFNQKLLDEIKIHLSKLPENTFKLYCHTLNAHQVWNSRLLEGIVPFAVWQLHDLDKCGRINDDNYKYTLKVLHNDDLERTVEYKTSKGQPFKNTVRDILFHVINHTTHHRGQIICDFRNSGIEPIITDYIFYKR